MAQIYRLHYRAQLQKNYTEQELADALEICVKNVRKLQQDGRILTAALYRKDKMLFLYYEALGEELTVVYPTEFLAPLADFLQIWPGQVQDRLWVHMYHIYYHCVPESIEQWKRPRVPELRRGRIAFLRDEKLFSYTYFHKAIVDEGLLTGDKYQSIALHENILFSYFEEPKILRNVQNRYDEESKVIQEWLAVDPESHFIHMPEGNGGNFMFIPALFALGVEDFERGMCDEPV